MYVLGHVCRVNGAKGQINGHFASQTFCKSSCLKKKKYEMSANSLFLYACISRKKFQLSNRKVRISESRKCVAARLTQCCSGEKEHRDLKMRLPITCTHHRLVTSEHEYIQYIYVCVKHAYMESVCVTSLQFTNTVCHQLPDTGAILASSFNAHHPSIPSP